MTGTERGTLIEQIRSNILPDIYGTELVRRAIADKARRWEFIDTAEDVGAFAGDLASARRDCLWHRLPDGVADREND